MNAEPRGHTVDGTPWEEPRPPHLPDRLTSISPWVLPFLGVVLFQLWVFSLDQPRATDAGTVIQYWLDTRYRLTGLLGSLVGLALFFRHPDARTTLPQIATGALMLLAAHVMGLLEQTLDPVFVVLAPPSGDLFFLSPLKEAYSIFTSLVAIFGIAFIATGLSAARRYETAGAGRGLAAVLVILAVVSTVLSIAAAILQLTTAEFEVSPALVGTIIGSLFAWFLRTLALSYLVVVTMVGWIGQEAPRSAWRLAAVGAALLLFQAVVVPFLSVFSVPQEGLLAIFAFIQEGVVVGWVLLVAAFALGLPSTEAVVEEETAGVTRDRPAMTTPGSGGG